MFTVKISIFETERHQATSPFEYFTLITALSCNYEISLLQRWVEKYHPKNIQFKAHELHSYSFLKVKLQGNRQ